MTHMAIEHLSSQLSNYVYTSGCNSYMINVIHRGGVRAVARGETDPPKNLSGHSEPGQIQVIGIITIITDCRTFITGRTDQIGS